MIHNFLFTLNTNNDTIEKIKTKECLTKLSTSQLQSIFGMLRISNQHNLFSLIEIHSRLLKIYFIFQMILMILQIQQTEIR